MREFGITEIVVDGVKYFGIQTSASMFLQRREIRSASEDPLSTYELLVCTLCERLLAADAKPNAPVGEITRYMADTGVERTEVVKYHDHLAAMRAREAIPEGWKLVPVEPTDDMLDAGERLFSIAPGTEARRGIPYPGTIYDAMLSAAHKPGATNDE